MSKRPDYEKIARLEPLLDDRPEAPSEAPEKASRGERWFRRWLALAALGVALAFSTAIWDADLQTTPGIVLFCVGWSPIAVPFVGYLLAFAGWAVYALVTGGSSEDYDRFLSDRCGRLRRALFALLDRAFG